MVDRAMELMRFIRADFYIRNAVAPLVRSSDVLTARAPRAGQRLRILALVCFAMLLMSSCAPTSTGLVVESVNNYSLRNGPSISNSIANGDGFYQGMTVAGSPLAFDHSVDRPECLGHRLHGSGGQ